MGTDTGIDKLTSAAWDMFELIGVRPDKHKDEHRGNDARVKHICAEYGIAIKAVLKLKGEDTQASFATYANDGTRRASMSEVLGVDWPGNPFPSGKQIIFDLAFFALVATMAEIG